MLNNCIAVVETPLQLLCSHEINYENVYYIIRLTDQGQNDVQTIKVAKLLGLNFDTIYCPAKSYISFFKFFSFIIFKYYRTKSTCIFLGTYFSKYLRLLSFFFKRVWYLDDGLATLKLTDQKINLFTFIRVSNNDNLKVLKHDFENLKEKIVVESVRGNYFIGQPVVEKGLLDEDSYFKYISKSVFESNGVLNYIPHRMECDNQIKKIMGINGVKVMPLNMCVELYFISSLISPNKVYSYSSSALLTLCKLFPKCTFTFYIFPNGSVLNEKIIQQFLSNGIGSGNEESPK